MDCCHAPSSHGNRAHCFPRGPFAAGARLTWWFWRGRDSSSIVNSTVWAHEYLPDNQQAIGSIIRRSHVMSIGRYIRANRLAKSCSQSTPHKLSLPHGVKYTGLKLRAKTSFGHCSAWGKLPPHALLSSWTRSCPWMGISKYSLPDVHDVFTSCFLVAWRMTVSRMHPGDAAMLCPWCGVFTRNFDVNLHEHEDWLPCTTRTSYATWKASIELFVRSIHWELQVWKSEVFIMRLNVSVMDREELIGREYSNP